MVSHYENFKNSNNGGGGDRVRPDDSEDEGACYQANNLSSNPGPHMVERKNRLDKLSMCALAYTSFLKG